MFLFTVLFLPAYFLAFVIANVFKQPVLLTTLIFDGMLTYFVLSYDPQGRSFFEFIGDFLIYLMSPKVKDLGGSTIQSQRKLKLFWKSLDLRG